MLWFYLFWYFKGKNVNSDTYSVRRVAGVACASLLAVSFLVHAAVAHAQVSAQPAVTSGNPSTGQQVQQEEIGFALAHAVEIHFILSQCGADPSLARRAEQTARDYAARLPAEMRTRSIEQGNVSAQSMINGPARDFFCAEARQLGGEWVTSLEMMRQNL